MFDSSIHQGHWFMSRWSLWVRIGVGFLGCWSALYADPLPCSVCHMPWKEHPLVEKPSMRTFHVSANTTSVDEHGHIHLVGQVQIFAHEAYLSCDEAIVYMQDGQADSVEITQNAWLLHPQIQATAERLTLDIPGRTLHMERVQYLLAHQNRHGRAKQLVYTLQEDLKLVEATYSSCDVEAPTWVLQADNVHINADFSQAQSRGNALLFQGIPWIKIPYLEIPLGSQRRSGWLFPKLRYSAHSGLYAGFPYYVAIADNAELLATPYYAYRTGPALGWQAKALWSHADLALQGHIVPSDTVYRHYLKEMQAEDWPEENLSTQALMRRHTATRYHIQGLWGADITPQWSVFHQIARVSDDHYWRDFGTSRPQFQSYHMPHIASLSYQGERARAYVRMADYQTLHPMMAPEIANQWRLMPEVGFAYQLGETETWDASIRAQGSHFEKNHTHLQRLFTEFKIRQAPQTPWVAGTHETYLIHRQYHPHHLEKASYQDTALAHRWEKERYWYSPHGLLIRGFSVLQGITRTGNENAPWILDGLDKTPSYEALLSPFYGNSYDQINPHIAHVVGADLSGSLQDGTRYELRIAQELWGKRFHPEQFHTLQDAAIDAHVQWSSHLLSDFQAYYNAQDKRWENTALGLTLTHRDWHVKTTLQRLYDPQRFRPETLSSSTPPTTRSLTLWSGMFGHAFHPQWAMQVAGSYDLRAGFFQELSLGLSYDNCCFSHRFTLGRHLKSDEDGQHHYHNSLKLQITLKGLGDMTTGGFQEDPTLAYRQKLTSQGFARYTHPLIF